MLGMENIIDDMCETNFLPFLEVLESKQLFTWASVNKMHIDKQDQMSTCAHKSNAKVIRMVGHHPYV